MPDRRAHRGPHADDRRLFGEPLTRVRAAADDLCWLLSRRYAAESALKLVGDRYRLEKRQRIAVARCACADEELLSRTSRRAACRSVAGAALVLDGFNLLVTVEAALSGGIVLEARDGCYRDLASMHGTYRKVGETRLALELIGRSLADLGAANCRWLLDSPVSNSGRLKMLLLELAAEHGWSWQAELAADPDRLLVEADAIAVTADSGILDRCGPWFNLAREVVDRHIPAAWIVKL
jgi:hypothetical protein